MFQGDSIALKRLPDGIAELCFDRRGEAINKFDERTVDELRRVVALLTDAHDIAGVLVTSAKDAFIVGADITEFEHRFRQPEDEVARSLWHSNAIFMAFEDLQIPTVAAINGFALGGGCEMALTTTYRVMETGGRIGVPEVKLGLFPGFGGTVRLPRVASVPVAIAWIESGTPRDADQALADGVVDEVCARDDLRRASLAWLARAVVGDVDWRTRQTIKRVPVPLPPALHADLFGSAIARSRAASASSHRPAASMAIALMSRTTLLQRDAAQWQECEAFTAVTRTQAGKSLVQAFLNDQSVKRLARARARSIPSPLKVALPGTAALHRARLTAPDIVFVDEPDAAIVVIATSGERPTSSKTLVRIDTTGSVAPDAARSPTLIGLRLHGAADANGLAEVLSGPDSDEAAIAATVSLALAIGRPTVVVRDGAGSVVDRVLDACREAWDQLRTDGACDEQVRAALLAFGWTLDPERLGSPARSTAGGVSDADMIERITLAMVVAAATALESNAVGSAAELDTALRLGAGLPAYFGGPFQYADWLGLEQVIVQTERLVDRGPRYHATPGMHRMATMGRRYYQTGDGA